MTDHGSGITGAGEFFLLLAPAGDYTEELFRQDIETIRAELGNYCALPHVARRIIPAAGIGTVTPVIEGIFLTNREGKTGDSSALFTAFQALLGASALPAFRKTPEQSEIEEIIADELVTPVYQPIFSLHDGELYGYEALSRITRPGAIITTEELFAKATDYGLASPLEMLCRRKALIRARELGITKPSSDPFPQGSPPHYSQKFLPFTTPT